MSFVLYSACICFFLFNFGRGSISDADILPLRDFSLQSIILDDAQLMEYKKGYDEVFAAIYSIKPKQRLISKSNKMIVAERDTLEILVEELVTDVSLELGTELSTAAKQKIAHQSKYCRIGASMTADNYFMMDLSHAFGGTSKFGAAVFGCRKLDDDKVLFAINVYQEIWEEQSNVRLNLDNPVWNAEKVEQFAYYLLYNEMKKRMNAVLV